MNLVRVLFRICCACILVLAIIEIAWMHPSKGADTKEPSTEKTTESKEAAEKTDSVAEAAEPGTPIEELEKRKAALDDKERDLAEQDRRLKEREKEIEKKLKEMENLRAAVSGELEGQKKANEERVNKMVSVFETMTPKSASGVLETLDDWLAVDVLKRMDSKKVAKIMNIMDKNRSAKLSEMLTGYYRPDAKREISSVKQPAGQAGAVPKTETPAQEKQPPGKAVAQAPAMPQPENQKKGGKHE